MATVSVDLESEIISFEIRKTGEFRVIKRFVATFPDSTVVQATKEAIYNPGDDTSGSTIADKASSLWNAAFMTAYNAWIADPETNPEPNIFE